MLISTAAKCHIGPIAQHACELWKRGGKDLPVETSSNLAPTRHLSSITRTRPSTIRPPIPPTPTTHPLCLHNCLTHLHRSRKPSPHQPLRWTHCTPASYLPSTLPPHRHQFSRLSTARKTLGCVSLTRSVHRDYDHRVRKVVCLLLKKYRITRQLLQKSLPLQTF
jgi:hypothetical protein